MVNSAADLLNDVTFLGFCSAWKRDGRCDLALVDYLKELGLEQQSETARWAAEYRDRPNLDWGKESCGPYPGEVPSGRYWWYVRTSQKDATDSDDLWTPNKEEPEDFDLGAFSSFSVAIAALLDHYRPTVESLDAK